MDTFTIQKGPRGPRLAMVVETYKDGTKVLRFSVKKNEFSMETFRTVLDADTCKKLMKCIASNHSTKIFWKERWHIYILPFHPIILFPTENTFEFVSIEFNVLEWEEVVKRLTEVADQRLTVQEKRRRLAEGNYQPSIFDATFRTWLEDNGWQDLRYEWFIISQYWRSVASDGMVTCAYEDYSDKK